MRALFQLLLLPLHRLPAIDHHHPQLRQKAGQVFESSQIWVASSRVGARISDWMSGFSVSQCSIKGMPKASVLPVPVGALR